MATLCFFGTYDPDAPRVKRLMAGWEAVGGTVVTCHAPMWPGAGERAALPTQGGLGRWLTRWLSTRRELWAQREVARDAVAVLVPYPGHFDVALARRLGKPVVFDPFLSLWDTAVGDRKLFTPGSLQARALKAVDRWALRSADVVLADTGPMADFYSQLAGVERVAVVPVGADETLFHPRNPSPRRGEDSHEVAGEGGSPEVLFYGRMIPLHGTETIVEAARLLPDVPFHLIGEGQVDPRRLDLPPNVRLTPSAPYETLPSLIADAAICLGIFGTSEKAARVVPHKVYEAAAMARPVITADTPAIREAFPEGALTLVPPGDPLALAAAIQQLLADPTPGTAAHARFLEAFSTPAIGRALQQAIEGTRP